MTAHAALRPGAAMMPPPGCAPEPHRYSPRTGVRYLRPARRRPQEEQLLERQLAVEDVALGQPELALEVERRQHLPVQDDVADVRRELRDRVDDGVAERLALARPRCVPRRWYGAYCTKHDIMCLPGGATDGSVSVGITMSMYGRRENRPYFASS